MVVNEAGGQAMVLVNAACWRLVRPGNIRFLLEREARGNGVALDSLTLSALAVLDEGAALYRPGEVPRLPSGSSDVEPSCTLTAREVAERLNVSTRRVTGLCESKKLAARLTGKGWLIAEDSLLEYQTTQTKGAA